MYAARFGSINWALVAAIVAWASQVAGQEPDPLPQPASTVFSGPQTVFSGPQTVFSGPQIGEQLTDFRARHALGDEEGKDFDLLATAENSPQALLLIFVHEVTRPSIALTRLLATYAHSRHGEKLGTAIVFLEDNPTEAINFVRRARHALPTDVTLAASIDGKEGPGAYGLNRKVTLTVLLAKQRTVTANFALIQPSLAVDAPQIGTALERMMGSDLTPTLESMSAYAPQRGIRMAPRDANGAVDDGTFRSFMAPVIQRTATPEQVAQAAALVEQRMQEDAAFDTRVRQTAQRIIDAGRLANYGTEAAQGFLRKWAEENRQDKAQTE